MARQRGAASWPAALTAQPLRDGAVMARPMMARHPRQQPDDDGDDG
jgi:hypothetical protein